MKGLHISLKKTIRGTAHQEIEKEMRSKWMLEFEVNIFPHRPPLRVSGPRARHALLASGSFDDCPVVGGDAERQDRAPRKPATELPVHGQGLHPGVEQGAEEQREFAVEPGEPLSGIPHRPEARAAQPPAAPEADGPRAAEGRGAAHLFGDTLLRPELPGRLQVPGRPDRPGEPDQEGRLPEGAHPRGPVALPRHQQRSGTGDAEILSEPPPPETPADVEGRPRAGCDPEALPQTAEAGDHAPVRGRAGRGRSVGGRVERAPGVLRRHSRAHRGEAALFGQRQRRAEAVEDAAQRPVHLLHLPRSDHRRLGRSRRRRLLARASFQSPRTARVASSVRRHSRFSCGLVQ
ncbi:hypothetical protein CEXT_217601 [Caerostris extrusa]|uniref:Uncharacterized protein n=1 Tax=Caerostris extrusa TaxID=172846 RepID=A0AAV4S987_CAEEX|nr:hypothetical protein CEXT_217601 [Caerostris extrusa]